MEESRGATATGNSNLDSLLRPSNWADYIGQENIKQNLRILLDASRSRGDSPEHLLFYGPPGLGKTTLSYLIAKEIGAQIKITSGPAIDKVSDLASILTNLGEGDVLFIDEIHRLNKTIEEVLYPAMENGTLDIIIGKGPSARTVQLDLPPFTLVAATTRISLLSPPLRSRFSGGVHRLELYAESDIAQIIHNSARVLGMDIADDAAQAIACRARSTPRTANFLLKRCRDMAQLDGVSITPRVVERTMQMQGVDELGLSEIDRELLRVMIEKFNGGPVGLSTIAAAISEDPSTIEEVYEPYLLQQGLIHKTPRGREVTQAARHHLGFV
ncbi:MAG: Holliday junction branch migration DNA helicase RuvB [Patescibacteria group bacterium]